MLNKKIIFSIGSYRYLKHEILEADDFENGETEVRIFPDGERYQRILTSVSGRDVVLVGGTVADSDTLEMYDLAYALIKYGARSIHLVFAYFGYSTMERARFSGEVVTAKSRAVIFSSLPRTSAGNFFVFFDLHSEGIPYYFEGQSVIKHIYCTPIVSQVALKLAGRVFVLACTDAGRAKWVERLANDMGVNAAFVFKRRSSGEKTEITSISADVEGKDVVIYDDMIRTGGSLINAAQAYKDAGARKVYAITTHGLFSNDAVNKIRASGLFEKLVATNSHPNSYQIRDPFIHIESIAPLVVKQLKMDV